MSEVEQAINTIDVAIGLANYGPVSVATQVFDALRNMDRPTLLRALGMKQMGPYDEPPFGSVFYVVPEAAVRHEGAQE